MECREVRQLAEAFVSEQLLVETTRAIVAHLERCQACRHEIDGLRRVRGALRSAFETAPELDMRTEFAAELASRLAAKARRRPGLRSTRPWLAMAASALLLVGAGWGWRLWSPSSMSELLHAAIGDHRFCALAFKLAEQPISLEEAARRYGGAYGRLEAVEPATTVLDGGALRVLARHSCVFEGRRFAHIVLTYKGQVVSLLVTDDPRPSLEPGELTSADPPHRSLPTASGLRVASFRGQKHAVFVVSSLHDEDVRDVAGAMVGPVSRALAGA